MSTITIVTVAGGGNVPPAEAIARELITRGHGVQVLGQEHQRTRFETAGADFTALGSLEFWGDGKGRRTVLATVNNAARLASSRAIRAEVAENLARLAPDAVLVDVLIAVRRPGLARRGGAHGGALPHLLRVLAARFPCRPDRMAHPHARCQHAARLGVGGRSTRHVRG